MAWAYWPDVNPPTDDGHITFAMMEELRAAIEERAKIAYGQDATVEIPGDAEAPRLTSSLKQRYWNLDTGSSVTALTPHQIILIIGANYCINPDTFATTIAPANYSEVEFKAAMLQVAEVDADDEWDVMDDGWVSSRVPTKKTFNRIRRGVSLLEYFWGQDGMGYTKRQYTYQTGATPPESLVTITGTLTSPITGAVFPTIQAFSDGASATPTTRRTELDFSFVSGSKLGNSLATIYVATRQQTLTNGITYGGTDSLDLTINGTAFSYNFPVVTASPWESAVQWTLASKTNFSALDVETSDYGNTTPNDVNLDADFGNVAGVSIVFFKPGFTYP